jgi:hypothetical protein
MTLNRYEYISLGMVVGAAIGTAIGSAMHQMGAWLPIGIGVGLAIALSIADRTCGQDRPAKSRSDINDRKLQAKN